MAEELYDYFWNSIGEKMSNSVQKIESLQALRALAFLGIFLLHVGCGVEWATLGVACFFVLSGFLLVNSYRGKELELSIFNNFKFSIKKIKIKEDILIIFI